MSSRINAQLAPLIRPISSLRLDEHNARTHDERNLKAVADSLARFGQQKPVVALRDGRVIAGNGTVQSALRLGWTEIAVVEFDSEDAAVAAGYAIADNRTSDLSRFDRDALLESIAAAESGGVSPELLGFGESDLDALRRVDSMVQFEMVAAREDARAERKAAEQAAAAEIKDVDPETPPESPRTRQGDLWHLGEHRLLCGDSTKAEDVARVMGSDKAALCCTDPPYGVNFQDAEGKNIAADIGYSVIPAFFGIAVDVVAPGRALLIFGTENNFGLYTALAGRELKMRPRLLFWRKPAFVMRHHDYHSQFECIYYCWKQGGDASTRWRGGRDQSDVWDVGRDVTSADKVHPTQKPVELFVRAMLNHTDAGEIVFEPFSGSGSQLIAAEKLGRRCAAIEIDPRYVDVAVVRWQKATGKQAVREDGVKFDDVT